jgi:cysteine desulfurase
VTSPSAPIFLDHASTTPCDPEVIEVMRACLAGDGGIGNPSSSTHYFGKLAADLIEQARSDIAALIGADPRELIFTSGATESDNLAILGIARGRGDHGRHLITSRIEHKAVLDPCKYLQKRGWQITWLEPQADGLIDPETLRGVLRSDTQLVSIMHANNETGIVQDIAAIARLCREAGVLLHVDAAQSVGKLPLDVHALDIDLLSLSAHKMYGPKGIGALYVSARARPWLEPLTYGGGHERGLRPGTLATHQIAGFAAAARLAANRLHRDAEQAGSLVHEFKRNLADLAGVRFNDYREDHPERRLPGLVSVTFERVEGESLLAALPEIAVSSGAACDSASGEPSYVLRAQGVPVEWARSTLRVAFGRGNTTEQARLAATVIRRAVLQLRDRDADSVPAAVLAPDVVWAVGEAGSYREGMRVRCYLACDAHGRIAAVGFRAFTCPDLWRVLQAFERQWLGHRPEIADLGAPAQWALQFQVPIEKLGRLIRVEDAWRAAKEALESKHSRGDTRP